MPSDLHYQKRLRLNFRAARADAAMLLTAILAAALVVCALPGGANASAPEAGTAAAKELQTMPAAVQAGFAALRSASLVKIDRSDVEIASEILHPSIENPLPPLLRQSSAAPRITGVASTYNPCKSESGGGTTASGEAYNPEAWTAAIQIDLRAAFAGVRYGRNYKPVFALVTSGEKSIVLRINDVGPLRPGRVIDLNERAMRYFDSTLDQGVLAGVQVQPLMGERWRPGAIEGGPTIGMAGELLRDSLH